MLETISGLLFYIEDLSVEVNRDDLRESRSVKDAWTLADSDGNGKLDFKEIEALLNQLNIDVDKAALKNMYKEFDADGNGQLDFDEFTALTKKINHKEEIEELFQTYAEDNDETDENPDNQRVIFMPQFTKFLQEVQQMAEVD